MTLKLPCYRCRREIPDGSPRIALNPDDWFMVFCSDTCRDRYAEVAYLSFKDVCERLKIPDYCSRIFGSNSHGELMHLEDYYWFASLDNTDGWFREIFLRLVAHAEATWKRPESVFQHMRQMMDGYRRATPPRCPSQASPASNTFRVVTNFND